MKQKQLKFTKDITIELNIKNEFRNLQMNISSEDVEEIQSLFSKMLVFRLPDFK